MRFCYEHPDFPLCYLIVYKGDSSVQNRYPHGNAKSEEMQSTNFIQTKKSKREEMKKSHDRPNVEYKRLVANAPTSIDEHEVTAPRNIKQVANFQSNERRKLRISRDDLNNLYEMAHSSKFIREIVSFPDVMCVMFQDQLWEKVRCLLNRVDIPHLCS